MFSIFFTRENEFQIKWDFVLNLLISLITLKNNLKLIYIYIYNDYRKIINIINALNSLINLVILRIIWNLKNWLINYRLTK